MKIIDKMNIPAANQNGVHYGHAVMPYQNAIYIYGTKSDSTGAKAVVHVAKAELVDNKLANFVYWDGASWQADATKTAKLEGLQKNISEQFNVFSLNEKLCWFPKIVREMPKKFIPILPTALKVHLVMRNCSIRSMNLILKKTV